MGYFYGFIATIGLMILFWPVVKLLDQYMLVAVRQNRIITEAQASEPNEWPNAEPMDISNIYRRNDNGELRMQRNAD